MRAVYILGLLFAVAYTQSVFAAQVYLDAPDVAQPTNTTFYIPIRLDTQDVCVNAVHVALAYDPSAISVKDVSIGDSILTLWAQEPVVEKKDKQEVGRITFSGGVPGGYCGRVSGDLGRSDTLARLVVAGVRATSTHIVMLPDTQVYLHDGEGTKAPLTVLGADLSFVQATSTQEDVWLSDIKNDTIAPEYFEITLVKGPSKGNKRHYIVFSTTDKQSGVDHYEVLETNPDRFGFLTWIPDKESHWVEATSPYVLRDQKLQSKILVKAVDKNGNERVVEYTPPLSPIAIATSPLLIVIAIFILLVVVLIALFVRYRRAHIAKKQRADNTVRGDNTQPRNGEAPERSYEA